MPDGPKRIDITNGTEAPEEDEERMAQEASEAPSDDEREREDAVEADAEDTDSDDQEEEDVTIKELQAEIKRLEEALEEEHDRHLRAVAELQNFKRRTAREQQQKQKYAGQSVISEILPVMDNLRRVLEHQAEGDTEDFAKGVEMTVEEFFRVLEQLGVTVIECEGEPFDPDMHEAVARVETEEVPEGTVVAVDTPGYCLHDRCLRPARVVVAAEGPSEDDEQSGSE